MDIMKRTVYRPPLEANSALLEISLGCSYGKCTFCRLSNGETPLQLIPLEVLRDNLMTMARQGESASRMFLLGENVLAFRTRYLLAVFDLVRNHLPNISQFAMYARGDDVSRKTDTQLAELRVAGLDTLYIGVESENAQVLKNCRKGETPEMVVTQLHRLDRVGISYGLSSILGLGGTGLWQQHALDTAALYNQVRPDSIRVMTLTLMAGTPLAQALESGAFTLASPELILQEELLLLENIHYSGHSCFFVGTHISNAVPLAGNLPEDKAKLLERLQEAAYQMGKNTPQQELERW